MITDTEFTIILIDHVRSVARCFAQIKTRRKLLAQADKKRFTVLMRVSLKQHVFTIILPVNAPSVGRCLSRAKHRRRG